MTESVFGSSGLEGQTWLTTLSRREKGGRLGVCVTPIDDYAPAALLSPLISPAPHPLDHYSPRRSCCSWPNRGAFPVFVAGSHE